MTLNASYIQPETILTSEAKREIRQSVQKKETRSRQLNLDENLEALEGKRKRAKVDYTETGP